MTGKMMVQRIGVMITGRRANFANDFVSMRILCCAVLFVDTACAKRPCQPAGGPVTLNVSGTYSAHESLYSSTCPGMTARPAAFPVHYQMRWQADRM